ncbi:MAG: lipopolysaccharide biosynthesis protein [Chloroflexota bacterium]
MIQRLLVSIRQDGLLSSVIKGSAHLFRGNVAAAALAFFQGVLATRLLGVDGFGLVSGTIIVFVSNINTLLSFRMSETVVRFAAIPLSAGHKEQAAATIKLTGLLEVAATLLAYAVLLLLAPWGAARFAHDASLAPWIALYGLAILGNIVYETATGILRLARRFDLLARITLAQSVLTFGLIARAFFADGGLADVLLAYLAGKLLAGALVTATAFRQANRDLGCGWWRAPLQAVSNRREILSFSINTNLNGTLNLFTRDMVPLYLSYFSTSLDVGYFRLAQGLINLVMLPIEPFIWPTYTEITRAIAARQWQLTQRLLKQVSAIATGWVLPAATGLALFGPWLIPLMYGPDAAPAYPAVLILALGYGFATIFQWNRPLLLALGKPAFPVQVGVATGMIEVALMFLLTPQYGYLAHAAILTGFFIASIGLNLWRGLSLAGRQLKEPH